MAPGATGTPPDHRLSPRRWLQQVRQLLGQRRVVLRQFAQLPPGEAAVRRDQEGFRHADGQDRKSTRLNSSHVKISYAVFCLKKKKRAISDGSEYSTTVYN